MKAALAALALLVASPAGAECYCLKCATGIWRSYHPHSGSMKPTLEPGGCVIIKRGAKIDRGSIIVFRHPVIPETDMVKRLIGLPGDVIEMKEGRLVLNGIEVPQVAMEPYEQLMRVEGRYEAPPRCPKPTGEGEICQIPRFTETLSNGSSYDVLDIETEISGNTVGPFTVPPNHVFVLGDNRDNSADSRIPQEVGGLGFIPAANILGPVVEISNP